METSRTYRVDKQTTDGQKEPKDGKPRIGKISRGRPGERWRNYCGESDRKDAGNDGYKEKTIVANSGRGQNPAKGPSVSAVTYNTLSTSPYGRFPTQCAFNSLPWSGYFSSASWEKL